MNDGPLEVAQALLPTVGRLKYLWKKNSPLTTYVMEIGIIKTKLSSNNPPISLYALKVDAASLFGADIFCIY